MTCIWCDCATILAQDSHQQTARASAFPNTLVRGPGRLTLACLTSCSCRKHRSDCPELPLGTLSSRAPSVSGLQLMRQVLGSDFHWQSIFVFHLVECWILGLQLMQGRDAVTFGQCLATLVTTRLTPSLTEEKICHETKDSQEGKRCSDANADLHSVG